MQGATRQSTKYAVLLRGVNVGGRSMLSMAELREALSGAGFADVTTYLQSGNAVLAAPGDPPPDELAAAVATLLSARFEREIGVIARAGAELAAVIAANPFPDLVATPTNLHVAFLSHAPDAAAAAAIEPARLGPDTFALGDRCAYLRFANGSGRSRLGEIVTKSVLGDVPGAVATTRNWNTVLALAERTAG